MDQTRLLDRMCCKCHKIDKLTANKNSVTMLKRQLTVLTSHHLSAAGRGRDAVQSRTNIQLILAKYRLLCPALARGAQDTRVTALSSVTCDEVVTLPSPHTYPSYPDNQSLAACAAYTPPPPPAQIRRPHTPCIFTSNYRGLAPPSLPSSSSLLSPR